MAHYQQWVGTQIVTVKSVRNCYNSPASVFHRIIYQTLIRSFLMNSALTKIKFKFWAGQHCFFTFILCFWGLILRFLAFFCVLYKGGVYLKFIGFLYKRLAGSGKEYEIGFSVRYVTVMRFGDGIMQHHNELAKKK